MSTKVAILAMVKDECDIIELFVRINARSVDHLYVVDHNSQDGTQDILLRLRAEGLPLTIFKHEDPDFQQAIVLTNLARQVAATNAYDFILPLDADEFIHSPDGPLGEVLSAQIPADDCGLLRWTTYVPFAGDYRTADAPLHEVFRQRLHEPTQFHKVAIRNEHAKVCIIAEGNHCISVHGQWLKGREVTAVLQHVPVRSVDQITAKALLGSRRLSVKVGRNKANQGMHWDRMAEKIRAGNYLLSPEQMLEMAFMYVALPGEETVDTRLDEAAPRIGLPDDRIQFKDLARINLVKKMDQFLGELCAEVRVARGIPADH